MRYLGLVCIHALLGLSCVAAAYAQGGSNLPRRSGLPGIGMIMGRVVLPSGGSVSGSIRIKLTNFATSGVVNYTDPNGEFSFRGLGSGTYHVEVLADPTIYDAVVETVNLPPNGRVVLTIHLREKSGARSKGNTSGVVSVGELAQKVPSAAKKEFDKASDLIAKGKNSEAIPHLKRAIEQYPDYVVARNTLGVEYLKTRRYQEAAEQLEAAVKIDPKRANSRLYLGIVLTEQKRFPEAVEHLTQAFAADEQEATTSFYLGIAALGANDLRLAEESLNRALTLSKERYALAYYYLAHVYIKNGDANQAAEKLKAYIDAAPNGEQIVHARSLLEKLQSK